MQSGTSEKLNAQAKLALKYAADKLHVFPVCASTKRPLTRHGHLEASANPDRVAAWWQYWPAALAAMPTGIPSRLWVLDVDGEVGRLSLNRLLPQVGCGEVCELARLKVETPGGGWHFYFQCGRGERPRTRAGDIAAGLDTRGEGGYIILPGNVLPDGRQYRADPQPYLPLAAPAPRGLLYLATYSSRERAWIAGRRDLHDRMMNSEPAGWPELLKGSGWGPPTVEGTSPDLPAGAMRRQALHDLEHEARDYSRLEDGRRNGLFTTACRLVRYVAGGVLTEGELKSGLRASAEANGAIAAHGPAWFDGVISRALAYGAHDVLPPLARQFRKVSQ